jgi:Fe2+ transport system protein B
MPYPEFTKEEIDNINTVAAMKPEQLAALPVLADKALAEPALTEAQVAAAAALAEINERISTEKNAAQQACNDAQNAIDAAYDAEPKDATARNEDAKRGIISDIKPSPIEPAPIQEPVGG